MCAVGACAFETERACLCGHTHIARAGKRGDPLNPCPPGLSLAPAHACVRVRARDWLLTCAREGMVDALRLVAYQLTARLGDTSTSMPACRSSLANSPRPLPAFTHRSRHQRRGRAWRLCCAQKPAGTGNVVFTALHTAHASLCDSARQHSPVQEPSPPVPVHRHYQRKLRRAESSRIQTAGGKPRPTFCVKFQRE